MDDFLLRVSYWISSNSNIVASLAGSFISGGFSGLKTWREKLFAYISGALCAKYVGGEIARFLHFNEEMCGFLIGVFGLSLCAAFLKAISKFGDSADIWDLIKSYVLHRQSTQMKNDDQKEGD